MAGSFRTYGKIDPYLQFQHENKRRERRRIITIVATSIFLVVAVIGVIVGVMVRNRGSSSPPAANTPQLSSGSAAILAACNSTTYRDTCIESFSDNPESLTTNPLQLVTLGVKIALSKTAEAYNLSLQLSQQSNLDPQERMALEDCSEILGHVKDYLNDSVAELMTLDVGSLRKSLESIEVLLSTASSEQTACSDGLYNITGSARSSMLLKQDNVDENLINAIDLVVALSELGTDFSSWKSVLPSITKFHLRRLLNAEDDGTDTADWVSLMQRELQEAPAPSSGSGFDMVIAQDGSGNYRTLKAGLNAVPAGDYSGRYVIYIKAGVYNEGPLNISKSLPNLTLLGDGCNKTIITGDANVALKGYTTYRSATVGIAAKGLLARNITFRNTAGPYGEQAVAMRANAENVIFDGCCFDGYQDTLYALSGKQFYTGCTITGTVDFIFGNALAVFQNCYMAARLPAQGQQNTYTAQGRKDKSLVTGFAFQNCSLIQTNDLKNASFPVITYLGRPWKAYSTSVFLQSYYEPHISPQGWLDWNISQPFRSTCFYAEYSNTGPGSNISGRVKWEGVHPALTETQASQFTVESFFPDTTFIPAGVSFQVSL